MKKNIIEHTQNTFIKPSAPSSSEQEEDDEGLPSNKRVKLSSNEEELTV
jgi:hypothetical protein